MNLFGETSTSALESVVVVLFEFLFVVPTIKLLFVLVWGKSNTRTSYINRKWNGNRTVYYDKK